MDSRGVGSEPMRPHYVVTSDNIFNKASGKYESIPRNTIQHDTKLQGLKNLVNNTLQSSTGNLTIKNPKVIEKNPRVTELEAAQGKILRSDMEKEMKDLRATLKKFNDKVEIPQKEANKVLEKLALLKLGIDRCDQEVLGGGITRLFRQNFAKAIGYSTTDDARALLHDFDKYLRPDERKSVLKQYGEFKEQFTKVWEGNNQYINVQISTPEEKKSSDKYFDDVIKDLDKNPWSHFDPFKFKSEQKKNYTGGS